MPSKSLTMFQIVCVAAGLSGCGGDYEFAAADDVNEGAGVAPVSDSAAPGDATPQGEAASVEGLADDGISKAEFGLNNACYSNVATDCSVPWYAYVMAPELIYYGNHLFSKACVRHDYCYRHGSMTYGRSRYGCDVELYDGMKRACSKLFFLGKPLCYANAELFYNAVRLGGASHFKTYPEMGCCEYAGPASTKYCGCVPNCAGKLCGSDGCGGNCGSCGRLETCVNGSCALADPCGGALICK